METTDEEININLYLGIGDHYLFSCADDYNQAASSSDYDFCSISDLTNVYAINDAFKINMLPMYCSS